MSRANHRKPGQGALKSRSKNADGCQHTERTGSVDTMATIRASCETCGDVELTTADVKVRVCINDNRGEYSFRCPQCSMTVVKGAEPRTIDLLVASGVAMDTWSLPAELDEPKTGLPISHDELLEFHDQLHDASSWSQALEHLHDS